MAKSILIDSGFWYAFFNQRDQHFTNAHNLYEDHLYLHTLILPWPTLYESLNTRFSRRIIWIKEFSKIITRHEIFFVDDSGYRKPALDTFLLPKDKPFSLVDIVIRNILEDNSLKIDAIVTFNEQDFSDICYKRQIKIVNG